MDESLHGGSAHEEVQGPVPSTAHCGYRTDKPMFSLTFERSFSRQLHFC
jgi:hypothetical protein